MDEGERQAIQLALNTKLPLLIEEEAGRKAAYDLGLQISGIAGQIWKGFRSDILNANGGKEKLNELLKARRINTKIHNEIIQAINDKIR